MLRNNKPSPQNRWENATQLIQLHIRQSFRQRVNQIYDYYFSNWIL